MTQILSDILPPEPLLLGQVQAAAGGIGNQVNSLINGNLGASVLGVLKAVFILILGLIIASVVKGLVKKLLNSTDIDNRIARSITGQRGGESIPVEDWISSIFYWLILLFAIVAFLNALELEAVSAPLNTLLNQVTGFLPKILGAAFLVGIAWVVATVVKTLVGSGLNALNLDQRLGADAGDFSINETIGNALYWFIFLLFLPSILGTLQLQGTLAPIQGMLDQVLGMLPNILGAVILGAVFWFVANIVRRIVTNLLAATGVDSIGSKVGISGNRGQQSLSSIIGTIVFALILIVGAVPVLDQLQIEAISAPAIAMLDQVMVFLPRLVSAGAIIAFFYVAGQFVSELVTNILTGVGFNNLLEWLGISGASEAKSTVEPIELSTEQPTVIQTGPTIGTKTPSELVGVISQVAIMLVGTLTAIDILDIPALEDVVRIVLAIAGQVFIGLIVFAIGLYLANMAFKLILSTGSNQSRFLAQTARVAIMILVGAMALNRMGIAPNIVNLAFGLLLGGIAVAVALAFGLGGREVAREELRSWISSFKGK